ncbi:MAG TPA: alkene reductase, partial [Steroidobacteraceae bacterium]|nr:alkene reductase [Steroidobacteraceae bacterium]
MTQTNLFTPGRIGTLEVPNRMIMAPMTRNRCLPNGVHTELGVEYYSQRAGAGLILTEGTAPSAGGIGYARTPAIETPEQIAAWQRITEAVTARGGRMFMQLMHVGRIGSPLNRYTDRPLVAPSAVKAAGQIWTDAKGLQDFVTPHALSIAEIAEVIESYAQATRNALAAGFKGVELHSASGYLPMQFLSSNTNQRNDQYGGSAKNRIRFVLEVLDAMIAAAGSPDKVGIKISPAMPFNDIHDADPVETYTTLVKALAGRGLAYLHVLQTALPNTFELLRPLYPGTFAAGGGFTRESGNAALASGLADFIVYGKLFIANPDLPERFARNAPLNTPDPAIFYSPGPKGYVDFPP